VPCVGAFSFEIGQQPSFAVEILTKFTSDNGWGKGAVQLVELPAPDETFDNIVAFWNPADKPEPGQERCSAIDCIGAAECRSHQPSPTLSPAEPALVA
jgi:glucan biosynthesis protein MdoG